MVSFQEKGRATQFICDLVEETQDYNISTLVNRATCPQIIIKEKPNRKEKPKRIVVLFPNFFQNTKHLLWTLQRYNNQDTYCLPVFYKDCETAFVHLLKDKFSWRQYEELKRYESLKKYSRKEVSQIISLRRREKEILEKYSFRKNHLIYYLPEDPSGECLQEVFLERVLLDYSHISPDDFSYNFVPEEKFSSMYRLPREKRKIKPSSIRSSYQKFLRQEDMSYLGPLFKNKRRSSIDFIFKKEGGFRKAWFK